MISSSPAVLTVTVFSVSALVVAIAAAAFLLWKRNAARQVVRRDLYDMEFLPPVINGTNTPKEQTYVVPKGWRPSSSRVYSPLSIPVVAPSRTNSLFDFSKDRRPECVTSEKRIYALAPTSLPTSEA